MTLTIREPRTTHTPGTRQGHTAPRASALALLSKSIKGILEALQTRKEAAKCY